MLVPEIFPRNAAKKDNKRLYASANRTAGEGQQPCLTPSGLKMEKPAEETFGVELPAVLRPAARLAAL